MRCYLNLAPRDGHRFFWSQKDLRLSKLFCRLFTINRPLGPGAPGKQNSLIDTAIGNPEASFLPSLIGRSISFGGWRLQSQSQRAARTHTQRLQAQDTAFRPNVIACQTENYHHTRPAGARNNKLLLNFCLISAYQALHLLDCDTIILLVLMASCITALLWLMQDVSAT